MNNELKVSGVVLGAIIAGLILIPIFGDTTIFLTTENGGTPISCAPENGLVLAQNITDLCDVTVIDAITSQTLEYNGTQWINVNSTGGGESTECINVGSGTNIIKNSTSGNCYVRTIIGSGDISISNNSNTIIIDFNGTVSGESTQCFNVGGAILIIKNSTSGNCYVKSLTSGTGISITNGTNTITITNSLPESTVCSNLGTVGEGIYVSGNCDFKKLVAGTGITLSANGTRIMINSTGGGGETNTASNVGTFGSGIFAQKVGVDLQFTKILTLDSCLIITSNSTNINLDTLEQCEDKLIGQQAGSTYFSVTKTNIGNSYVDIYTTNFDEEELMKIDFTNATYVKAVILWDYVGTGNHQLRWVDINNNSNVLIESVTFNFDCSGATQGCDTGWVVLPSWAINADVYIEWQGKSTIAGDDPIAKGYKIMVK